LRWSRTSSSRMRGSSKAGPCTSHLPLSRE
jgi:hypothetical protein